MTVIDMAAVVINNKDVFFCDADKEANLVELWAQNQCLYETTSEEYKDRSKRSRAYNCLFEFLSKAPKDSKFLSPLYPGSCPNMSLPSRLNVPSVGPSSESNI